MVFENGVKNIPAAAYNGAHTVIGKKFHSFFFLMFLENFVIFYKNQENIKDRWQTLKKVTNGQFSKQTKATLSRGGNIANLKKREKAILMLTDARKVSVLMKVWSKKMPQNLTCDKIWKINVNFQEIEFQYEDSCIVMDQFEGNETKFYLVID